MLRIFPVVTILFLFAPIAAGFFGALGSAFGTLQGTLASADVTDGAWTQLTQMQAFPTAVWLSIKVGVVSTLGALGLCFMMIAGWQHTRAFGALQRALSPLLSVPHAAAALGLAFMVAPSGWLSRSLSPMLTGWERPPDVLIVNDIGGWSLIFGLIAKEIPFLLLMSLAALTQVNASQRLNVVQSMGYGKVWGWCIAVMPAVYGQIRLPVYAVLAYGMSNVDMALVLGPTTPAPLSVLILQMMTDPDLSQRAPGAAAALVQLALVAGAVAIWRGVEVTVSMLARPILTRGHRAGGWIDRMARAMGLLVGISVSAVLFGGLLGHLVWSFAGRWRFPQTWPEGYTVRSWDRYGPQVIDVTALTLCLALIVALIALVLVLGCLESEVRSGRPMGKSGLWVLYTPLIFPQISFLPGLQVLFLRLGVDQGFVPVLLSHLIFVIPYVFLTLAGPFRSWDGRYQITAATMGAGANAIFWRLRLPMLLLAVLTSLAVGMAVSVGQYLPTLLTSGGRLSTLSTEALALASGGDRRAIGVWSLCLTAAAWLPFAVALSVPRIIYRNNKGMHHG